MDVKPATRAGRRADRPGTAAGRGETARFRSDALGPAGGARWAQRAGIVVLLAALLLSGGCRRRVEPPREARRFCIGLLLDYGGILEALQEHSGDESAQSEGLRRLATYTYTDMFVQLAPAEQRERAADMEFGIRKAINGELSPAEQRRLEVEFEKIKLQATGSTCPRID